MNCDEDMANVGRSLMAQIESNYDSLRGWHPLCDPAEIVVELINQRDEAERQLQEAVEERDRWKELCRKAWSLLDVIDPNGELTAELEAALTRQLQEAVEERDRYRGALQQIENPIAALRNELKQGERLDGMAAAALAKDAEYLRSIARAALTDRSKS